MGSEIAALDPNGEDFGQWEGPFLPATHRVTRGAIWRKGVMTLLPNLPGGNNANVFWINNLGQVSGNAENAIPDSSCSIVTPFQARRFQPVIWGANGDIQRVLSPLAGDTVAFALTINDHGQTVGGSGLCSTIGLPPFAIPNTTAAHAVLWEKEGPSDISAVWAAEWTLLTPSIIGVKYSVGGFHPKTARFTHSYGLGGPACWTLAPFPGRSRRWSAAATPTMIEARSSALASSQTIRTSGAPSYGKAPSLRTSMLSSAIRGHLCT